MRDLKYETPEVKTVSVNDLLTELGPAQATLYTVDSSSGLSGSSGWSGGKGGKD